MEKDVVERGLSQRDSLDLDASGSQQGKDRRHPRGGAVEVDPDGLAVDTGLTDERLASQLGGDRGQIRESRARRNGDPSRIPPPEILRGPLGDHQPVVDDGDPIAELVRLVQVMGCLLYTSRCV